MAFSLKKRVQSLAQRLLGFERYLVLFSAFKILTLRWDGPGKEGDFNQFLKLLQPDDHVLDIGANIGIMSVLLARACSQGQVHAFEPIPENIAAYRRIIRLFGITNATLHETALGSAPGHIEMRMPVQAGARMQGLAHVNHDAIPGYEDDYLAYEARVDTLDRFFERFPLPWTALKIDVENFEQFVLRGGMNLLQQALPVIFCELWDNENRQACFGLLTSLGYRAFVWHNKRLKPFDPEKDPNHNFLFIPPSGSGPSRRWAALQSALTESPGRP